MTLKNVSFASFIVGKLRQNLADYNSVNRTGNQWIYPDKPQIQILMKNKNNFPRISVTTLNQPTIDDIGLGLSDQIQSVSLKIVVYSVRDLICTIKTTTDESHTYATGTDVYSLDELPYSDIISITGTMGSAPYIFVKNVDFTVHDSTGSGMRDSVKWIADTPDDTTQFLVSYKRIGTGQELVRIISQNINTYLRTWRDWDEKLFWSYKLTNSAPVDFDEHIGVSRYEISIQFEGINIGDEI